MVSLSEILHDSLISVPSPSLPSLPTIVPSNSLPLPSPSSISDLNLVLQSSSLPSFHPSDSLSECVSKLARIKSHPCFDQLEFDSLQAVHQSNKITACLSDEQECDIKEVELANLRVGELERYNNKETKELKNIANEIKMIIKSGISEQEYNNTIQIIQEGGKEAAEYLGFMKNETEGAYFKYKVLKELKQNNKLWCKVLEYIIENNGCTVNEIESIIKIERVALLKVIYSMCSKGIIVYDRHSDKIIIN